MQKLKTLKSCDPRLTTKEIKGIFKDIGITFTEEHHPTGNTNFYSSRVKINNNGLGILNWGANGKGLSKKNSLANAYCEFIERVQNSINISYVIRYATKIMLSRHKEFNYFSDYIHKNNLALDFLYAPDEQWRKNGELDKNEKKILEQLTPLLNQKEFNKAKKQLNETELIWLPFYNVKNKKIKNLPFDLIMYSCGNNGMCSGNTKEQAIVQGICRIFENYFLKKIYEEEITPPSIPETYFESTEILKKLNDLRKDHNYNFIIKDCSLDMGLPVIGLIVIDQDTNSYCFKIGSDITPIKALEKCAVGLYHGGSLASKLKKINITKNPFEGTVSHKRYRQYISNFLLGYGSFPKSLFNPEPNYTFKRFKYPEIYDDKDALKHLTEKLYQLGFDLYIRDSSYLDFPAFLLYVPGMSELIYNPLYQDHLNGNIFVEWYKKVNPKFHIRRMDESGFRQMAMVNEVEYVKNNEIFPFNTHEHNAINRDFLVAILYYKIKDYKKAYLNLDKCLSRNADSIDDKPYYLCARDYMYWKSTGKSDKEIKNILKPYYKHKKIEEVSEGLKDEDNVFKHYKLPNCFCCDNCEVKEHCKYFDIVKIVKTLQEKYKQNVINQLSLQQIFDF